MKTVHEYLSEIDSDELANQYMVDFPPDDLEWLSHKDMRIGEYYDLRKQAIRKFIDKLRSIEPCATEDGEIKIFISHAVDTPSNASALGGEETASPLFFLTNKGVTVQTVGKKFSTK